MNHYHVNPEGYYGEFGGAYIPEMLAGNITELRMQYLEILENPDFRKEFTNLLYNYAGRPTPLYEARRLSKLYQTTIYLKREDLNHTGAHKINNTIGQVLLAERMGKKRIIAETGAGQHGVATATVCAMKGLECTVYMGALDVQRQSSNVYKMKMLGATVITVHSGNKTLKDATNEALRDWINHPDDTHYVIGSVVGPHPYPDLVARLQSVISSEVIEQFMDHSGGGVPDFLLACIGGGSNAAGGFYHFLEDERVQLVGAEAAGKGLDNQQHAATLTLGTPGVLHGSHSLLLQDPYGQITEPYSVSAGLDYPGVGPLHAYLKQTGRCRYIAITDLEALAAGMELTRTEGIIPALESAHALALLKKLTFRSSDQVVIILSGRGDKDLDTYRKYFDHEPD